MLSLLYHICYVVVAAVFLRSEVVYCYDIPTSVILGVQSSWQGSWRVGANLNSAILMAIENVNNDANLLPNTRIDWVWDDDWCHPKYAVESVLRMRDRFNIDVLIASACSTAVISESPITQYYQLPMISWGSASGVLSDKNLYPNFLRVVGPFFKASRLFVAAAPTFGWGRVAVVYSADGLYQPTAEVLYSDFQAAGIEVAVNGGFTPVATDSQSSGHGPWMDAIKASGVKAVFLLAYCHDLRLLLLAAKDRDMLAGYAFFTMTMSGTCFRGPTEENLIDGRDQEALEAFDGVYAIAWWTPTDATFANFMDEVVVRRPDFTPYILPPNGHIEGVTDFGTQNVYSQEYGSMSDASVATDKYAPFLYDAIMLYAYSLNKTIFLEQDVRSYQNIFDNAIATSTLVPSVTGPLVLDENGDRSPDVNLQSVTADFEEQVLKMETVGQYYAAEAKFQLSGDLTVNDLRWSGGVNSVPVNDVPQIVLHYCTALDWNYTVSACDADTEKRRVAYQWVMPKTCDTGDLPTDSVLGCDMVPEGSATAGLITAMAILGTLVSAGFAAILTRYRARPVVKFAQRKICYLYCLGGALSCLGLLAFVGENTDSSCMLRPWVFHLSLTLMFGALFVKVKRVASIFSNRALKKTKISNNVLYKQLVALLMVDVIMLGVWSVWSPSKQRMKEAVETGVGPVIHTECFTEEESMVTAALLYKVGLIGYGAYLAYSTRGMDTRFSEGNHIMLAIYNIAFVGAITLLVGGLLGVETKARIILQALATGFCVIVSLALVFVPKLFMLNADASTSGKYGSANSRSHHDTSPAQSTSNNEKELQAQVDSLKMELIEMKAKYES